MMEGPAALALMTVNDDLANEGFDCFILTVFEEALLEAWAGYRGFHQLRIDGAQGVEIVFFYHCRFNLVEDPGISYLRLFALRRIAFAVAAGKRFFKDKAYIQLRAPAETFGKRQRQRITIVDLSKQERVRRIDTVAADHARVNIQRHQRPLTGTAAGDHEVDRFRIQQDAGHDPEVNVGQMMIVLIAHADVEHRESFFVSNGVKLLKDDGVFVRLAVLHHQCNLHGLLS